MVATGNTALAALKMMKEWGLEMNKVSFLGIIGSKKALEGIEKKYPEVEVSLIPHNTPKYGGKLIASSTLRLSMRIWLIKDMSFLGAEMLEIGCIILQSDRCWTDMVVVQARGMIHVYSWKKKKVDGVYQ
jgi:hypothetical protein